MICKQVQTQLKRYLSLLILCMASGYASAELIDDVRFTTDANGEVDAVITFTVPVQRLRYFPQTKSELLTVYFNILDSVPRNQWQDYESHRSPPSDLIQGFTVTTKDLNTGPRIEISFSRPAEYKLKTSKDFQRLYIHIKPDLPKPSAERAKVTVPPVVLPSAAVAQLGGKDGLPEFPAIAPMVQVKESKSASEPLDLKDQINKANNEAGVLMAAARDALLAGQIYAAVEAFNKTLDLPPNRYTQDAQIWIGIAREKSGQPDKARLEYETYLKLYPKEDGAPWVSKRLARLNSLQPKQAEPKKEMPVMAESGEFHSTQYGSLSMYYYHGASRTDTVTTVGNVEIPSTLTVTDQSSLISNVSVTARGYNDNIDNRFVFQDFYSANFLPGQRNRNRLNAAYYELRDRSDNFAIKVGRQSAFGGGVLGRFDGVSAGLGMFSDWRINVVAGQLADYDAGIKPRFKGASLDFGLKNRIGGSIYTIKQSTGDVTDRRAVGGILRYFDQSKTAVAMVDYDTQFKMLNMVTLQGTILGDAGGTDYNFYLDSRKTPSLSVRNAVNGTTVSIDTMQQNGFTNEDLLYWAKLRTATSNVAQFGLTNHLSDKWQTGTDFTVTNTSGMPASGTLLPDGTTGTEGFVAATPSTGNMWTISERLIGNNVISSHDVSILSLSYTKTSQLKGTTFLANNHMFIGELWTIDSNLRLYWQTDNLSGKQKIVAPMLKLGYRARNNLTLETEAGFEWTNSTPSAFQSSRTTRRYLSLGFRWDF